MIILSIVIPCFNESLNLPLLVSKCLPLSSKPDVEVIFVDNGSTDDSQDVLTTLLDEHPNFRCVHVETNIGYGNGILRGLEAARGEILSWTHADLQCDPMDLQTGYDLFANDGKDLFVKGARYGRSPADTFFTFAMGIFESVLLRAKLWDINAQPTMFTRDFYNSFVDHAPLDFSLDLYVYHKARQAGIPVKKFPVYFGERAFGVSHWNIDWKSKWKFIRRTISFSFDLRRNRNKWK